MTPESVRAPIFPELVRVFFDDTAPLFSSATANLTTVTITYDESLDTNSTPSTSDFTVRVGGSPVIINSVSITGTTVVLTLAANVGIGTEVSLDYNVPVSNPVQDVSGNDAVSLSAQSVSNTTLPTFTNVSPSSSSYINYVFDSIASDISFTIDATLASGSITATRTSGNADANSPHVCNLVGTALNSGTHTIDFSDTTNGCTSNVSNFVSGTVYTFVFAGTDTNANVANPVTSSNVTFDNTVPSAPGTPDLASASDSGSSSTDDYTNDNTPTFNISCESGASVFLFLDDATQIGTGTCSGGTVSITSSALSEGVNVVKASQTDAAGNSSLSYSSTISITIDTTRPTTPGIPDLDPGSDLGTSSTDNTTNDTTPTFNISCDESTNIVTLDTAGVAYGTGTCDGSTVSITSSARSAGPNNFRAYQTDLAGNSTLTPSSYLLITIDTTPPAASGTPNMTDATDSGSSSTDNNTSDDTPDFSVTCEPNGVVTLYVDGVAGQTGTCSLSSTVTITSATLSGTPTITSRQTDKSGNEAASFSSGLSVTIDTTAPTTSGAPNMTDATDSGTSNSDDITSDTTPTFTGSCTDGNTVQLYDDGTSSGSSATCASSVFSLTTGTLASGSNSITFKETDTAGNTSSASSALVVTIDTTSPTISEVTPIGAGTDTTPDYTFTTDEAGTITYGGSCTSATTSATSGSNTITLGTLAVGSYSDCTVIVTDASGNASNTLTLTSFTISAPASTSSSTNNLSGSSRRSISSQLSIPNTTIQTNTQTNTTNTLGSKISTTIIPKTFSFTRTLSLNMRGGDIITLQKFLNASGFIVSKTGNGSPGKEIQTFGPGTRAALAKFQASVGIKPSIGFFGPITQSYVNNVLRGR